MKSDFKYSVLQYRHSPGLGEALNIGVLFLIGNSSKVIFKYSNNLDRYKNLYPNFSITFLKSYLSALDQNVKRLNKELNTHSVPLFKLDEDLNELIKQQILIEDATSLQFQKVKSGILFKHNEGWIEGFTKNFIPFYGLERHILQKRDEQYLSRKFKSYLNNYPKAASSIQKHTEIKSNDLVIKVDFVWENGTTNLVKPLSFDLSDKLTIQNKAITSFGTLTLFKDYLINNNYRFDIIVSKPHKRNLYKSFDKALEVIVESKAPVKIVNLDELANYAEEAATQLLK